MTVISYQVPPTREQRCVYHHLKVLFIERKIHQNIIPPGLKNPLTVVGLELPFDRSKIVGFITPPANGKITANRYKKHIKTLTM